MAWFSVKNKAHGQIYLYLLIQEMKRNPMQSVPNADCNET